MFKDIEEMFTNFSFDNPFFQKLISLAILTIFVFLLYHFILYVLKKSISMKQKKFGEKGKKRSDTVSSLIRSTMRYFTIPVYLLLLLQTLGINTSALFASAGFLGLVLGFAFQDLLKDIVSGFFIIIERAYEVGDYVKIGEFEGTVKSVGIKTTVIISYTGDSYIINNRDVSNVVNSTTIGFYVVVNRIEVGYKTNIDEFKESFAHLASETSKKYNCVVTEPQFLGVDKYSNNGMVLLFHTKVKMMTQFQYRRDFNLDLLEFCKANHYEIPYQTITIDQRG